MKKLFGYLLLLVFLAMPLAANASNPKMDSWLNLLKKDPVQTRLMLGKSMIKSGDVELLDCFVKTTNVKATEEAIIAAGGKVRTKLNTIITANIPLAALDAISARDEVVYMEAPQRLDGKMNAARSFTNVDDVQSGTGLDSPYKGDGVMVGIVDDSLNWTNSDFDGRMVFIAPRTITGGTIICDKDTIDAGDCDATDGGGLYHGTHVTGIAAGGDSTYTGVAPEAWIGFVFNSAQDADSGGTFSTAVIDGVDDLFAEADYYDIATVVNLSLGTSIGAHDNTSLMEEGLNELVDGQKGRIIVNAAGNENVNPNSFGSAATYIGGIHSDIDVAGSASEASRFGVWRDKDSPGKIGARALSFAGALIVDVWLDEGQGSNCAIDVLGYGYNPDVDSIIPPAPFATTTGASLYTGNVAIDGSTGTHSDGKVKINVTTTAAESQNNKPRAIVQISLDGGTAADIETYAFDIVLRETSGSGTCTGNMWLYPDQTILHDFLKGISSASIGNGTHGTGYNFADGDSFKTTTIPGTASGVITVGSYMGRGTYTDINGDTQSQDVFDSACGGTGGTAGDVSLFSSLGPTADGRNKPELVAPGEPILSTKAPGAPVTDATLGDSNHWKLEGTSMASPHVTGIVALMLEKNNCLTVSDVKTALTSTANVSTLNSKTADAKDTYGYGIVDALAAMQAISADKSCHKGEINGGGGSSGCGGTMIPVAPSAAIPMLAMVLAPLAVIVWRRRK